MGFTVNSSLPLNHKNNGLTFLPTDKTVVTASNTRATQCPTPQPLPLKSIGKYTTILTSIIKRFNKVLETFP